MQVVFHSFVINLTRKGYKSKSKDLPSWISEWGKKGFLITKKDYPQFIQEKELI